MRIISNIGLALGIDMDIHDNSIQIETLPLPAFVADKKTGEVLYANNNAALCGIERGDVLIDSLRQGTLFDTWIEGGDQIVTLRFNNKILSARIAAQEITFSSKDSLLLLITQTQNDGGQMAITEGIIEIFSKKAANTNYEFLKLTAQHTGAFCATLYETGDKNYIIKAEWRERKSVCIPILNVVCSSNIEQIKGDLQKLKNAQCAAAFSFSKANGTNGIIVYYFDQNLDGNAQKQIEKFVSIYQTVAPDFPKRKNVLNKGLNMLDQAIAIWDTKNLKLLYKNKAYADMFGKKCASIVSERFRVDLINGYDKSTEYTDEKGRNFLITHVAKNNKNNRIVATLVYDVTKFKTAEKQLEEMAKTDALTGLLNRRAGIDKLKQTYEQCRLFAKPLTVCFADIDGLKRINDTYGHGTGDALIRTAAQILNNFADEKGFVCRLGGDEFVLVLPETKIAEARLLALSIEKAIAKCCVCGKSNISMSFGFVQAEYTQNEAAETLISIADSQMYIEKGRKSR